MSGAPKVRLTHLRGSRAGQVQLFDATRVRLGRRPDNDVVFDEARDRACSGHHCELFFGAGEVHVRDLGSSNGTYVNGERVGPPAPIRTGDELGLGLDGPLIEVHVGDDIGGTHRMASTEAALAARAAAATEPRRASLSASDERAGARARSALSRAVVAGAIVVAVAAALWLMIRFAVG